MVKFAPTVSGKPKKTRLEREWRLLLDPKTASVIAGLAIALWAKYRRHVIITCIERTPAENSAAGGRKDSTHLPSEGCRGVDIRIWYLTKAMQYWIAGWLGVVWGSMVHVRIEKDHIHINVNKRWRTDGFLLAKL